MPVQVRSNYFKDKLEGCSSAPVLVGLSIPTMNSIALATPGGHELELCNYKAHD